MQELPFRFYRQAITVKMVLNSFPLFKKKTVLGVWDPFRCTCWMPDPTDGRKRCHMKKNDLPPHLQALFFPLSIGRRWVFILFPLVES
jgi:hypothetical protein